MVTHPNTRVTGELIQKAREIKGWTHQQLVDVVSANRDDNYLTLEHLERIESGDVVSANRDDDYLTLEHLKQIESGDVSNLSTSHLSAICDALDVDFGELYKGRLTKKPTTEECLEALEPGGVGTNEQRAIRLYLHCQITEGRACEILGISRWDMPIRLQSTGCTCPSCREYTSRY